MNRSWLLVLLVGLLLPGGCDLGGRSTLQPDGSGDDREVLPVDDLGTEARGLNEEIGDGEPDGACVPSCNGLNCGSDGCGGQCQACDDGDPCTATDRCLGGGCIGEPVWGPGCIYSSSPGIQSCEQGTLTPGHKQLAVDELNSFRQFHGLPPVAYDEAASAEVQSCALMLAANGQLSHDPPSDWLCFNGDGAAACSKSNLYYKSSTGSFSTPPPSLSLEAYLLDEGVETLGHRRHILNPFLVRISFGAVDGLTSGDPDYPYWYASALKVIYEDKGDIEGLGIRYVAYPQGDYPSRLFLKNWYLSFSAVVDEVSFWNNMEVDYSHATIQVRDSQDSLLPVSSISWNNDGKGLPNHLQWKVAGLVEGEQYSVKITGVKSGEETRDYDYQFRLVTP